MKRKTLFLAISLALAGNVSGAAMTRTGDLRADPLLAIDMNRTAVIDQVIAGWRGKLAPEQEKAVREALSALRADRLLAASVAPSVDGLLSVLKSAETTSVAAGSKVQLKGLGDLDLAYTPVTPCRIVDTRQVARRLAAGVIQTFDGYNASTFAAQGGAATNCAIPSGAYALATTTTAVTPDNLGFIRMWPANAAEPNASTVNFDPGTINIATGAIIPVDGANANRFSAKSPTGVDLVVDVVGYFNAIDAGGVPGPTGPTGPAGATGPTGPQGLQGIQGPTGPQGATGSIGATGAAGAPGAAGADGRTVLNGAVAPVDGVGAPGDFYIDTTANLLYGPKGATAWPPTGVSLVGPAGATGATGATGAAGADGATGPTGPAGATGATGPQGLQGIQGPTGPQGATGADGATGATGPVGATGATGPAGATGATGAAGAEGLDGNTVLNGTGLPTPALGFDGDFYLELGTTTLYGPKAAGAWPATGVLLVGPAGATGATGATGPTGAAGANGADGATVRPARKARWAPRVPLEQRVRPVRPVRPVRSVPRVRPEILVRRVRKAYKARSVRRVSRVFKAFRGRRGRRAPRARRVPTGRRERRGRWVPRGRRGRQAQRVPPAPPARRVWTAIRC